jgi:hypothetical protein
MRWSLVLLAVLASTVLFAQPVDPTRVGPKVGARLPDFSLPDQHGTRHTFTSLAGREGLMLVFFRSADW